MACNRRVRVLTRESSARTAAIYGPRRNCGYVFNHRLLYWPDLQGKHFILWIRPTQRWTTNGRGSLWGQWFENNWNSKGWLWLPYLKRKKERQFFLASRLKLHTRLSNDVNEETPGLIRSLKAQVQTYRVGMHPCTSCDSGAGIKLSARPIFKALIFRCQMPEPLQTRLMERRWERGGGKKTRQLAKLVQLQTEWGDSLYA